MRIELPEYCLIVVKGAPAQELATFARHHFEPAAIIGDDAAGAAGALDGRLARRELVALLATGAGPFSQSDALRLAKHHHASAFAFDFSVPDSALSAAARTDKEHHFRAVYELPRDLAPSDVEIATTPMAGDLRCETGPFDIIGDVHGCADELEELLQRLGYRLDWSAGEASGVRITPPAGRRLIFAGDLVDRGPRTPDVLRIAMAASAQGVGFSVLGNHDAKFLRWMLGRDVKLNHGLGQSAEQMARESTGFHERARAFLEGLDIYLWLDEGRMLVAHAGIRQDFIGRFSRRIRRFCLYGDTSGEKDASGLPIRYHWAAHYDGPVSVVYGHTPVPEAAWVNNTLCLDTGCCFGGSLTALRWPERQIVTVPALKEYTPARRPFGHPPVRPGSTSSGRQG